MRAKTTNHEPRTTQTRNEDTMTIATALQTRLAKITSTLNDALSALTLNNLDDAVEGMNAIENALNKGVSMWGELEVDIDGTQHASLHFVVNHALDMFRDALEEANHDITEMIDSGWADEGYEVLVQRTMEEDVLPCLEDALTEIETC